MEWDKELPYTATNNTRYTKWLDPHSVCWIGANRFKFDSSWDWLMPVVEKIEALPNDFCNQYFWAVEPKNNHNDFRIFRVQAKDELLFQVVEFIKWYNENKNEN